MSHWLRSDEQSLEQTKLSFRVENYKTNNNKSNGKQRAKRTSWRLLNRQKWEWAKMNVYEHEMGGKRTEANKSEGNIFVVCLMVFVSSDLHKRNIDTRASSLWKWMSTST